MQHRGLSDPYSQIQVALVVFNLRNCQKCRYAGIILLFSDNRLDRALVTSITLSKEIVSIHSFQNEIESWSEICENNWFVINKIWNP